MLFANFSRKNDGKNLRVRINNDWFILKFQIGEFPPMKGAPFQISTNQPAPSKSYLPK